MAAQEIRKVNPGDTVTVTTTQYLVPGDMLIDMNTAIDSLDYWEARYNQMTSWKEMWESRYMDLQELMKDKPRQSTWDKIQEGSLFILGGFAACEVTQ